MRYFTARVKGDRDATAPGTLPLVTVHAGQFRTHPAAMPLAKPGPGKRRTARVLKTEEKGSDVNLATYLLLDGLDGLYESAMVISDEPDRDANQTGDNFVLASVVMASVLFFPGVGSKSKRRGIRIGMLLMALALFAGGIVFMADLPQSVGI